MGLGVVMYELLTGESPFTVMEKRTSQAEIRGQTSQSKMSGCFKGTDQVSAIWLMEKIIKNGDWQNYVEVVS